jgi:ATP-dependent helicase/nuclease subunit B
MDRVAGEVTTMLHLDEGDFLPFRAAWPQARDGYLSWLAAYEAKEGARFQAAEIELEAPLEQSGATQAIRLVGRIDRVDELPGGAPLVMDYKTESQQVTRDRVRDPAEDTQLAFYAALVRDDRVRAAYVNVGERGETRLIEQPEVIAARDGLLRGMANEMARIAAGEAMPALGEGIVCEFCSARGLCRRDFWE